MDKVKVERGVPPFYYECHGDSDGEQYGYDHYVFDANDEEIASAPSERVGLLFAASSDLLKACYLAYPMLQLLSAKMNGAEEIQAVMKVMAAAVNKAEGNRRVNFDSGYSAFTTEGRT